MAILVSGLFLSRAAAQSTLERLVDGGFPRDQISVAMSDATRTKNFGPNEVVNKANDASSGAAVGGVVGALLAGAITVGAFAVLGPFAAVLAGMSGGLAGSLAGALVGAGIPEQHARKLSDRLEDGGIIVGVYLSREEEAKAKEIMRAAGGEFVQSN